ncbi:hypothetical protein [Planktotalea sp.]|uniref:hypothetical protein n=1 Tax=Planktotalea sp. TaxID=2029877 RepID=UPI003296CD66
MNRRTMIGALGFGILALAATTGFAQSARNCAPRDVIVERLAEKYGEARQSVGLGANNSMVEVFAANETGTWTITVTMANGLTCLVASGQNYETLAEALPAKGSDA